jgi:hypothetical protein
MAVSCGWSDDDSSVQRVLQIIGNTPSTKGDITTPLIAKGTTDLLTGGASILNYYNDLTVWSGGSMLGQSNTGKTFIRDPLTTTNDPRNTGNSPACNNPPPGYQCSTQGGKLGHDTVIGDTNLSSLSADAYFQFFFGLPPDVYRDNVATYIVDPSASLSNRNSTSTSSINGLGNETIWVNGDLTLSGDIGTQQKPVTLIVNGNLNLGSNAVVNGLVFVRGSISGNGSPTIYGALIGGGTASATGNLKIIFDPLLFGAGHETGKAAKMPGTWRDW